MKEKEREIKRAGKEERERERREQTQQEQTESERNTSMSIWFQATVQLEQPIPEPQETDN